MPTPTAFLREAMKAVPAVKYALGVGGIVAVIAIVYSFKIDPRIAFVGTVIMLVLMGVLVIFARMVSLAGPQMFLPALVFTWFALLLFMAVSVSLFSSVFFQKPLDLAYWLTASSSIQTADLSKLILANAKSFGEVADKFVDELEKGLKARDTINSKIAIQKEIEHIDSIIDIFPQIMFFNGVFISEFEPKVWLLASADTFSRDRDLPIAKKLEERLNSIAKVFDEHAPHIHGLGTDMIVEFRKGIDLRRLVVAYYVKTERAPLSAGDLASLRKELRRIYVVEDRLRKIELDLKNSTQTN